MWIVTEQDDKIRIFVRKLFKLRCGSLAQGICQKSDGDLRSLSFRECLKSGINITGINILALRSVVDDDSIKIGVTVQTVP